MFSLQLFGKIVVPLCHQTIRQTLKLNNNNINNNIMKFPTKKQMAEMVLIECYGSTETIQRGEALDKYKEWAMLCEGCEKERYVNIFFQLLEGCKYCSDI